MQERQRIWIEGCRGCLGISAWWAHGLACQKHWSLLYLWLGN